MLKDLPLHTRQSLYRCLDVTSEHWIESEPEITWAKYTCLNIDTSSNPMMCTVNGVAHSLFDLPDTVYDDGSVIWSYRGKLSRRSGGPTAIMLMGGYMRVHTIDAAVDVSVHKGMFVVGAKSALTVTYSNIADVIQEIGKRMRLNPFDHGVLTNLLQLLLISH